MKRIIGIFLAVMLIVTLASCVAPEDVKKGRFETKYDGDYKTIIVDQETGVMYLFVESGYGGGLSVMVDQDGKPLIWSD